MSKFKVGDKVFLKKHSCSMNAPIGTIAIVTGYSNSWLTVAWSTDVHQNNGNYYECDFELLQENKMQEFDMKTMPWWISVKSEAEFESAKEFIKSKGLNMYEIDNCRSLNYVGCAITNFFVEDITPVATVLNGKIATSKLHTSGREIKLTFKTVIDNVEYPVVESETQKKLRELEEQQRELADKIAKIRENM